MESPWPMLANLARELADVVWRVFSLERQFSAFKSIRFLDDLDDVEVLYDGETPPEVGDVLTYQGNKVWAPAAGGGAGGVTSTWAAAGYWSSTGFGSIAQRWNETSDGASGLTTGVSADVATLGSASTAGVWWVSARALGAVSDAVTQLRVSAPDWQPADASGECWSNTITWLHDGTSDVGCVTIGGHLVLAEGWDLTLFIVCGGGVEWQVDAHFVAPLDVVAGDCGG